MNQGQMTYTLIASVDSLDSSAASEIKETLEKGNESEKIIAMKQLLTIMANGENCSNLLMTVIRFVLPNKNKTLKKLLLLYFELCEKYDSDGKLKQEMILVW